MPHAPQALAAAFGVTLSEEGRLAVKPSVAEGWAGGGADWGPCPK
jgi:hypothetical protein